MRPAQANALDYGTADRWVRRVVFAVMVGVAAALTAVGAVLYG